MADAKRNAAALAVLDVWSASLDPLNPVHARVSAALPELAALYRAGVEFSGVARTIHSMPWAEWQPKMDAAHAAFDAALAAVADKLTGEGK